MRLTKIELAGFKSFADRTVFEFDAGITAILGPNGCGKSNVVDAVKWVLGEQSAKNLRGGEMLDVIFAGSEQRKALGYAEVNLTFDNSDGVLPLEFNEVCVTRRLYRSGESEYLINRSPSRLRDIRDLFLNTGIGTSAYSFIEQGRVEALLAAKPHDRRMVFEEAAGISKYKARRKESLARLERTDQHLQRVNDIVAEVEKRIRSVSRQAQNARRFQRLTQELKDAKGALYARGWQRENTSLENLRQERSTLEADLAREQQLAAMLSAAMAELQQRDIAAQQDLGGIDQRRLSAQEELTQAETEKARLQERILTLNREVESADREANELGERAANRETERVTLLASEQELTATCERLSAELAKLESECTAADLAARETETALTQARQTVTALAEEAKQLAADAAGFESEARTISARREALSARRTSLEETLNSLQSAADIQEAAVRQHSEDVAAATKEMDEIKTRQEDTRNRMQQATSDISQFEKERSSRESRLSTLRELEASMEGFFPGVRAVMQGAKAGKQGCGDIEGVAAELMSVKPDIALAIETALGAGAQNVITRSAKGARDAIDFLKREHAGRATFIPLDRIEPHRRVERGLCHQPGVLGEAVDLVEFAEHLRPAMEYMLAGVLVVETLDHALRLREGNARGVRMVTLDGDLVNPAGAMTGGRENGKKAGLVTRRAEMESLEAAVAELTTKIDAAGKRGQKAANEASFLTGRAREVEEARQAAAALLRTAENEFSARNAELLRLRDETGNAAQEDDAASARIAELQTASQQATARQQELRQRETEALAEIERYTAQDQSCRQETAQRREAFSVLRISHAESAQKLDYARSRLAEYEQEAAGQQSRAESCARRKEEAIAEKARSEQREAELTAIVGDILSRKGGADDEAKIIRERINSMRLEHDEKLSEERAATKRISSMSEGINSAKLKESECQLRIDSLAQKAKEELEVEDIAAFAARIAAAKEEEKEVEIGELIEASEELDGMPPAEESANLAGLDESALRDLAGELQRKINNIGPINFQAIEEQAELEARREFLSSQHEDLDEAKADLMAALEQLNSECSRRFDETFVKVRENFQIMFRRLFGGGRADLILEQSDDAFEAGIEIIAKPPGKEPSSISLLSGGEKALCAVALLLSIFQSKPSPFCILDEVDGPLDESNIDRFTEMIREFAQQSQFIVISHSKRTMSKVDTIYGVTMGEGGVSSKYSLRYRDAESQTKTEGGEEAVLTERAIPSAESIPEAEGEAVAAG